MKRIPKTFQLLGHTIAVRVISSKDWEEMSEMSDWVDEDEQGAWFPQDNLILIRRQKRSVMHHVFCHELTHAVLDMMNDKLSNNEQFVDAFGGLLAQAMDTAK